MFVLFFLNIAYIQGFVTDLTNEVKTRQKHQEIWEDGCILYVPSKSVSVKNIIK